MPSSSFELIFSTKKEMDSWFSSLWGLLKLLFIAFGVKNWIFLFKQSNSKWWWGWPAVDRTGWTVQITGVWGLMGLCGGELSRKNIRLPDVGFIWWMWSSAIAAISEREREREHLGNLNLLNYIALNAVEVLNYYCWVIEWGITGFGGSRNTSFQLSTPYISEPCGLSFNDSKGYKPLINDGTTQRRGHP